MVKRKRILKTFLELVKIPSPTFKEREVADYLVKRLRDLGFRTQRDLAGKKIGSNTGNIIARLKGSSSYPTLLFCAHLDTVEPALPVQPVVGKGVIYSQGQTILGADDKSGLAVILEGLQAVVEDNLARGGIEVVFTTSEEKGLLGSKNLDLSRLQADFGFVFDGEKPVGKIVVQAPWQNNIEAVFEGKAAHAGISPEEGVSAISAAARAIAKMKLGRIDKETTANIGTIKGGMARNIVPERVDIEGEARSRKLAKLTRQTEKICDYLRRGAAETGAQVQIDVRREYNGFTLKETDKVVKLAVRATKAAGVKPQLKPTGGGSDTNIFNEAGIPAVTLSTGMDKVHSPEESIRIDALEATARIVVELVRQVAK